MEKRDPYLRERALSLIQSQSTLHLATSKEGHAWVAPVYYVFFKSAFFFFSAPDSRHILEGTGDGLASAAISAAAHTWQEIRGVQMSGRITSAGFGLTAIQAVGAYTVKFPFTQEFFDPGQAMDLENFSKRFRVRLYRFDPTLVLYLDNQIRFGFRSEVLLP